MEVPKVALATKIFKRALPLDSMLGWAKLDWAVTAWPLMKRAVTGERWVVIWFAESPPK